MEKPRVGFIGLGIMGKPMALNLLRAGFPMTVFNRTKSRTDELAAAGASVAGTPKEVAASSEIVITIVTDSPDVEEVILGRDGVFEMVKPGMIVVDMSTISPEVEREIDQRLQEKSATLLDAPVSGGDVGARNATLAIMVGGRSEDFQRVKPLFEAMGKSITHCGPVGAGQLTKLCNQVLVSVNLLAVSEALTFARKNGLDPLVMIQAVQHGAAGSWQLSNLGPRIAGADFSPGFMIDLIQKDLRIVLDTAFGVGASLPAVSLVHQLFSAAQTRGDGRSGTQAVAKVLFELSGL